MYDKHPEPRRALPACRPKITRMSGPGLQRTGARLLVDRMESIACALVRVNRVLQRLLPGATGRETLRLAVLFGLCLALLLARVLYTGRLTFAFLAWNLFLAALPWVFAQAARLSHTALRRGGSLRGASIAAWLFGGAWLAFWPNSPYIITDLMHLRPRPGAPLWFDAILLFACAWAGLYAGLLALHHVHRLVAGSFQGLRGTLIGWLFVIGALYAGAAGVYIGRFLRWNSWDLLRAGDAILLDALGMALDPTGHPRFAGMTLLLTALLLAIYAGLRGAFGATGAGISSEASLAGAAPSKAAPSRATAADHSARCNR